MPEFVSGDFLLQHGFSLYHQVLAAVMHWHRSGPNRDDATAAGGLGGSRVVDPNWVLTFPF